MLAGPVAALVFTLAACGAGKQDEDEPKETYKVDIVSASFPGRQHLAEEANLRIRVQNKDSRAIPNLAVTIEGFGQRREDPSLADPERPVWILNEGPRNTNTALTNTWNAGPLPAGQTRTLNWKVTAVRAGTYSVRYRVAAGLYGKSVAAAADGSGDPKGSFIARISRTPRVLEQ